MATLAERRAPRAWRLSAERWFYSGMAALLALMAVKVKRRLDPARAARKAAGAAAALPVTEGSVA